MSTRWTQTDLDQMEKTARAKFVNSLSGAKSANLIGTVDKSGQSNLSIVSSCVHLGADPALMAMIMRPRAVARHTMDNIVETKVWTVNHVHASIVKAAHQTSARYPKDVSEFRAVGLTEDFRPDFLAPYVKEAKVKLGLSLVRVIHLPENDTEMVIGQIQEVYFDKSHLLEDGTLSMARTGTVAVTGLDHYHNLESLMRLSYAKPDLDLAELEV